MLSTGYSLHIGLNRVDPYSYGSEKRLKGAVNDAKAMEAVMSSLHYKTMSLRNDEATRDAVLLSFSSHAEKLRSGDFFVVTFAGHGFFVRDFDRDEQEGETPDKYDETWCLFDGNLVDDEIYNSLLGFKSGVRILIISDSCHSGTVIKSIGFRPLVLSRMDLADKENKSLRWSNINRSPEVSAYTFLTDLSDVKILNHPEDNRVMPVRIREKPSASVELIAASRDDEKAMDGDVNGVFTKHLLDIWALNDPTETYPEFFLKIKQSMSQAGVKQIPQRLSLGPRHHKFLTGRVFEI